MNDKNYNPFYEERLDVSVSIQIKCNLYQIAPDQWKAINYEYEVSHVDISPAWAKVGLERLLSQKIKDQIEK